MIMQIVILKAYLVPLTAFQSPNQVSARFVIEFCH